MEEIQKQLVFLCGSFLSGVAVMLAYEIVNVIRGLFGLRTVGKLIWDLLFFMASAVAVFRMVFLCNNGTLRTFFVFAFGAGAILYRYTFGTRISEAVQKGIRWMIYWFSRPFVWGYKKIRKKEKKS